MNDAENDFGLYLVRHGETEWNSAGRYQGAKDSALTPRGREQALKVGRSLSKMMSTTRSVRAYVSPLGRAQETAALIGQAVCVDIQLEPRFAEVSLGSWDGLSMHEIDIEYPGALDRSESHDWYFRSPDGETFEGALARIAGGLRAVRSPALIVTHALTGRLIRGCYEGLSKQEMLQLPVPQDGYYRLLDGRSEFIGAVQ